MTLYRHQVEAIEAAADGRSYVLTTGTGSGKSLAYIVPIVDHVLRAGSGRGVKALVLDELHTYRGRQGADVAMLVRRIREACANTDLQCVGTSATLSTEGTPPGAR